MHTPPGYRISSSRLPLNLLLFDMDGVLIDVSRSYREAIQKTVQIYLEKVLGLRKVPQNLITQVDIALFKSIGGFNNDWDLTSGALLYLLSILGLPPLPNRKRFKKINEIALYLRAQAAPFALRTDRLLRRKKLSSFSRAVRSSGGGLTGIRRTSMKTRHASWEGWVYRTGDIDEENLIKRIFQEIYLGRQFTVCYRCQRLFYSGPGYYLRERLLIPRSILSSLRKKVRLGIASGRPRFDAELALRKFRVSSYFDSVVTFDECQEEEHRLLRETGRRVNRSKPHPYSLLRAAQEIGITHPRCAYVGDAVDDMKAARAAGKKLAMKAIGFVGSHGDRKRARESLLSAGADLLIEDPEDLLSLLPPSPEE